MWRQLCWVMALYHLTVVTGPPGDHDGVKFGIRLMHKLHIHISWRVDIMLTDFGIFCSKQIKTWPGNTTWGEIKQTHRVPLSTFWFLENILKRWNSCLKLSVGPLMHPNITTMFSGIIQTGSSYHATGQAPDVWSQRGKVFSEFHC